MKDDEMKEFDLNNTNSILIKILTLKILRHYKKINFKTDLKKQIINQMFMQNLEHFFFPSAGYL